MSALTPKATGANLWAYKYWQCVLADFSGWRDRCESAQRQASESAERYAYVVREWQSDKVFTAR